MKTIGTIGLLLAVLLTGCAVNPERVATQNDKSLCLAYYGFRKFGATQNAAVFKAEIIKRGLVKESDFPLLDEEKFRIGQSTCHLYASWGKPERENVSVSGYGNRIQHVYYSRNYVYSRNGVISSYQQ